MTDEFAVLRDKIQQEGRLIKEIIILNKNIGKTEGAEKKMFVLHLTSLKKLLKRTNWEVDGEINKISITKPLQFKAAEKIEGKIIKKDKTAREKWIGKKPVGIEKEILKRFKGKKEKIIQAKLKKPSKYVEISHKIFTNTSESLSHTEMFRALNRDLMKANLQFLPTTYISVTLFTTLISVFIAVFIFLFFLFFNITPQLPIIASITESIGQRFFKTFWILFVIPVGTFLAMYNYPNMEKSASENRINQELPFAAIHMSAISESMVEPSNIFRIIISTQEYPYLEREFIKLINEINVYGYDLISALRRSAFNSPSKKLAELFNGMAITITSGGDLPEFFDKRAQSLLFEYRLEREKYTRAAETFMDIYISVVIAAPMILMLLLMIIKISGLGISLSMGMITLVMVLGIIMINIIFLTFLHLKQPGV